MNFQDKLELAIQEKDKEKLMEIFQTKAMIEYNPTYIQSVYELINEYNQQNDNEFLKNIIQFHEGNKMKDFSLILFKKSFIEDNQALFDKILILKPNILDIDNPYIANFTSSFPSGYYLNTILKDVTKQIKELGLTERLDMISYFLETTLDSAEEKEDTIKYFFNENLKPYRNGSSFFRLALTKDLDMNLWSFMIDKLYEDKKTNFSAKQTFDYLKDGSKNSFSTHKNTKVNDYIKILEEKELLNQAINVLNHGSERKLKI
jgi:hypothetical protein